MQASAISSSVTSLFIMAEDEVLESYADYLLAYNGKSIYTTYGTFFTASGGR